jgi:hypothetical protein
MAKFYPVSAFEKIVEHLQPQQETVDFLLNYSKSFCILKSENMKLEVFMN